MCIRDSLNDYLAGLYGLKEIEPTDIIYTDEQGKKYGLGRLGILSEPMTLQALAERVAERLGLPAISYVGNPGTEVRKVAVCSGGGGSRVSSALAEIADVYITGDVKYSKARDAQDFGLPLIIAGHYDTEIFCMDIFEKLLSPLGIPLLRSGACLLYTYMYKGSRRGDSDQHAQGKFCAYAGRADFKCDENHKGFRLSLIHI